MGDEATDSTHTTMPEYSGQVGKTRQEAMHLTCGTCGMLFAAEVLVAINTRTDPTFKATLLEGRLNRAICPSCHSTSVAGAPILYHDPDCQHFCLILPQELATLELEMRCKLLRQLATDHANIPDYVRRAEVVLGPAGLERYIRQARGAVDSISEAKWAGMSADMERREEELVAREEDLQAKQEDLVVERDKLGKLQQELVQGWADLERERTILKGVAIDIQTRDREHQDDLAEVGASEEAPSATGGMGKHPPAVGDRPQEQVDRWRASEDQTAHLLDQDRVFLLARLNKQQLECFSEECPELRVQLHKMPTCPVISLVIIPPALPVEEQGVNAIYWELDPASEADQLILVRLGQECTFDLDLYDEESRPVLSWEMSAPLAENFLFLMGHADEFLSVLEPRQINFLAAKTALAGLGIERLGKKQHNFSANSFQHMESPAATWLALGILSYWSEDENQEYLLFVKSFPLPYWRGIQERVVRRAMEFGLTLSKPLSEFALERKYVESSKDLAKLAVSNFAEVSLRIKTNDLDPAQEWENWKRILSACVQEEISLELEIQKLAAAAARRAGALENETSPGGDLTLVDEASVLKLLTDNAQRRDAALELCDRGKPEHIEQLFAAVCNMTRAEVSRVMPAMIHLGPGIIPHFLGGLKHRKSFIRQGSALALGVMKASEAAGPLMEMIFAEQTNLWREASRALGDFGKGAIAPIKKALKDADGVGRERLAWTLAQAALVPEALKEIQAMNHEKDKLLARVSKRAMELTQQVHQMDEEVRGSAPIQERTIIRSFSHCFFDALTFEVRELGEGDILEQEEVLEDSDILDEEVEIQDDDILGH